MTTATATEAPAAADSKAADETAKNEAILSAITNWDSKDAGREDAPVGPKLLNQVVPLFNKLTKVADVYKSATDVDEAVKAYTFAPDSDEAKLEKQIEQAKALIAKNEAILAEAARKAVLANVAPDFDEAKVKAEFKDTRGELKDKLSAIRDTFEMLGFVTFEISPAGRKTNFKGTNEYGEILVRLFDQPNIEGGAKSTVVDEKAKAERKAAKEWGRANGYEVADKGQISKELLEAYRASLSNEDSK